MCNSGLDTIKKRTKWAIDYIVKAKHLSNIKLAEEMQVATGTINSYRRMTTVPNIEFILQFCELYEFSILWFAEGLGYPFKDAWKTNPESKGPKLLSRPPDYPGLFGPDSDAPFITLRNRYPDRYNKDSEGAAFVGDEVLPADFVFVRQISGNISAGGGLMPDNSADIQCAFRRDWIKRRGGDPDNMSLIKVSGDSMEPTLLSSDLVLIDHNRKSIASQGGIYAISIDGEIMIKRIQPVSPDKLLVISDNKQYPPFEISTEIVRVNGKVVWFGRDLER